MHTTIIIDEVVQPVTNTIDPTFPFNHNNYNPKIHTCTLFLKPIFQMILPLFHVFFSPNEIDLGSCLMVLQTLFKKIIFLLVKIIVEMPLTQNVLRYLAQRDQKNAWLNIGLTCEMRIPLFHSLLSFSISFS